MKSTSCIKKDVVSAVRYVKRKIKYPGSIKINNAIYSNSILSKRVGFDVIMSKGKKHLRVYDEKRKFICIAEKSIDLPSQKKKVPEEEPYTMKIHK